MFFCEFCETLRTPFLQNTSGRLLLKFLWCCKLWGIFFVEHLWAAAFSTLLQKNNIDNWFDKFFNKYYINYNFARGYDHAKEMKTIKYICMEHKIIFLNITVLASRRSSRWKTTTFFPKNWNTTKIADFWTISIYSTDLRVNTVTI